MITNMKKKKSKMAMCREKRGRTREISFSYNSIKHELILGCFAANRTYLRKNAIQDWWHSRNLVEITTHFFTKYSGRFLLLTSPKSMYAENRMKNPKEKKGSNKPTVRQSNILFIPIFLTFSLFYSLLIGF